MIAVIGPNWEADLELRGLKRRGAELCVRAVHICSSLRRVFVLFGVKAAD